MLIVLAHPASIQDTRNRAEQLRNELEAQLTKQQVEAAWARAQAQPFEAVVNKKIIKDWRTKHAVLPPQFTDSGVGAVGQLTRFFPIHFR